MHNTMRLYNLIYLGLVAVGLVIFAVVFLSTRDKARARKLDISAWKRRENALLRGGRGRRAARAPLTRQGSSGGAKGRQATSRHVCRWQIAQSGSSPQLRMR